MKRIQYRDTRGTSTVVCYGEVAYTETHVHIQVRGGGWKSVSLARLIAVDEVK